MSRPPAAAPATPTPSPPPARVSRPGELARLGALSVISGCSWFLACADFDVWPLGWLAALPALVAIERASTTRRAVALGWLAGLVANLGGFYWITLLLERFGQLPLWGAVPLYVLLCLYQSIGFGLFAWAVRRIRATTSLPMALVAPVVMVTAELVVPQMFPYYMAITQAWQPHVIQVADLTGPLGVTALLFMTSGALYDLATRRRAARIPALAAAAVLVAALGYGHLRIRQLDARMAAAPQLDVGVVQGNIPFDEKGYENPRLAQDQLRDQQARSRELEAAGADLILWTESSYPYWIPRTATHEDQLGGVRRTQVRGDGAPVSEPASSVPLVFGAVTYPTLPDGRRDREAYPYNSALYVDRDGRFAGRFDKNFLLLFGERMPGVETFPSLKKVFPRSAGHFSRGTEVTTFPFRTPEGHEVRLAPMICFEDIIPAFGRRLAELRPHLLINLTNDTWFGATSEPWEHLALSVFRAVELRTGLVRAVNSGVSAFIDANGRVVGKTYAIDPAVDRRGADKALGRMPLLEGGHTVYAAVGDLFGWGCAATTAFLIVVWPRRVRRRSHGKD